MQKIRVQLFSFVVKFVYCCRCFFLNFCKGDKAVRCSEKVFSFSNGLHLVAIRIKDYDRSHRLQKGLIPAPCLNWV